MRATVYVHFTTRESLIAAITDRAISEVTQVVEAAEPERGGPGEALTRVIAAAWRSLGRFHALVAINSQLPQAELRHRHDAVLGALEPLIERGQRDGTFRSDVSAAWHLSMVMALVHAASAELQAGRLPEEALESALVSTVLGALT